MLKKYGRQMDQGGETGRRRAHVQGAWWKVPMALLLLLGVTASAQAQSRGSRGGHGGGGRKQQQPPPPPPQEQQVPAPSAPVSVTWPWLESGAMVCSSRDDLYLYQTRPAGGARPAAATPDPDCRQLLKKTGIQILDHDGPSRTKIVTTDESKESGWTNAYLPSTSPSR